MRKRATIKPKLGAFIRKARTATGLTQKQLGQRIGVEGHAVHRWENNDSVPTRRHQRELVSAIQVLRPAAAAELAAVFQPGPPQGAPAAAATTAPRPTSPSDVLSLAVFHLADDLDLSARRLRRPLSRFLSRLRDGGLGIEAAQQYVQAWIESDH